MCLCVCVGGCAQRWTLDVIPKELPTLILRQGPPWNLGLHRFIWMVCSVSPRILPVSASIALGSQTYITMAQILHGCSGLYGHTLRTILNRTASSDTMLSGDRNIINKSLTLEFWAIGRDTEQATSSSGVRPGSSLLVVPHVCMANCLNTPPSQEWLTCRNSSWSNFLFRWPALSRITTL